MDEGDRQVGTMPKLEAHQNGAKLHRAFSIFVFNSKGELLLQKRASTKYHAKGMWTNTCCSHPRIGEKLTEAAHRRLKEEMGFDCVLKETFHFIYKADVGDGLTEWEYDHTFFGDYEGAVKLNPDEAEDFTWVSLPSLKKDILRSPEKYTPWLRIAIDKVIEQRKQPDAKA